MLKSKRVSLGVAILCAAVAVAVVLAAGIPSWSVKPSPASLTFTLLNRPITDADRAAQSRITVDVGLDLEEGRLLATVDNVDYLVTRDKAEGLCLLVVHSPDDVGASCRQESDTQKGGLWAEFGNLEPASSYLAVAIPSEYANAKVSTDGTVVRKTADFALVRTTGPEKDSFVLKSTRYANLDIRKNH